MTEASETASRARQMLRSGRAAEACALLEPLADENAEPSLIRLLAQALAQAGDLNAALDRQLALVPPDVAQADQQGRADALAAAQLAQLATDYGRAADLARELAERDPRDIEAAQLLSTLVLWSEGPEAARAALAGIAVDDAPPDLLAQMLAFDDSPPAVLIDRVSALAAHDAVPAQERADLLLALAQHHDRAGRPDAAWETAERGNALAPARTPQDWRAILAAHLRIARETPPAPPADGTGHLYLLGTPRSGQSLLQSIFSAAPGVVSLGERGALLQHVLFRTGELARMTPAARGAFFTQLAEADRRGIARLAPDARLVVDKSPLHLAVAGSVARIHPAAAFAAVVRDPADTALSIWLRSFPPVYDYTNDFGAILGHLDFALDALATWRGAGVAIDLIDHAELIANPVGQAAPQFGRLGLAWDDAYLSPANRTQPVPTFSAAQVRRPIAAAATRSAAPYADRLAPWAPQIEGLREKLAKLVDRRSS